jgi:hypothetical protein
MRNQRIIKLTVCVTIVLFFGLIFMPMISSQQNKINSLEETRKITLNNSPILIKNITYEVSGNPLIGWEILFTVEIVDNAIVDRVVFDLEPFGERPGLPFSDNIEPYQWNLVTRSKPKCIMRVTAYGPTGTDVRELDLSNIITRTYIFSLNKLLSNLLIIRILQKVLICWV